MKILGIVLGSLLVHAVVEGEDFARVVLFVSTDCPVANSYAPTINRLHSEFASDSLVFTLVYPDPGTDEEDIRQHRDDFQLAPPGVIDFNHQWVRKAGATITPEVAVFDFDDELIYRGRIDNLYSDYGDRRREATEHDLRVVLESLLRGEQVSFWETSPVGCFIEPLAP